MISPSAVIASVLPVYLIIIAGAALRKTGVIRREHDAGIMRVIFLVMVPCFILDKILGSAVLRSGSVVLWSVGLGYAMIVCGILLGLLVGRLIGLERGTGMRSFALSAGCQNFGFTAAPVVESLWGTRRAGSAFRPQHRHRNRSLVGRRDAAQPRGRSPMAAAH